MSSLILLKSASVFAPTPLGVKDVLIAGNRIAAIDDNLSLGAHPWPVEEVDCTGMRLIPGLIDVHTHLTGGGGEAGARSRVPAPLLSEFTRAGVTTAIGLLGTDSTTRTIEELLAAARALSELGMHALCYTGSYEVPPPTVTGSVRGDIVHVDRIVAVGELALSDHRSSQPTYEEVIRIAADAHVAGMMTGKAGLVHFHMGDGPRGLEYLRRAAAESEIPPRVFHPTHVNRNPQLWDEAKALSRLGFTIDLSAFPEEPGVRGAAEHFAEYRSEGLDLGRVTMSSDGGGCLPVFDSEGVLLNMDVGSSASLLTTMASAVKHGVPFPEALALCTHNAATQFRLHERGNIAVDGIADLVVCSSELQVRDTIAGGRFLLRDGQPVVSGWFEA